MAKQKRRILKLDEYEHGVVMTCEMTSSAKSAPRTLWTKFF